MQIIFDAIAEWLKGLLVAGIMGNLGGLFDNVNAQVGEIADQVGTAPAAWNAGVFSMIALRDCHSPNRRAGAHLCHVLRAHSATC